MYELDIAVSDSGTPSLMSTAKITIEVEDVNEAPIFSIDYLIRVSTTPIQPDTAKTLKGVNLVNTIQLALQPIGCCSDTIDTVTGFLQRELSANHTGKGYGGIFEWSFLLPVSANVSFRVLTSDEISTVFLINNHVYTPAKLFRPRYELQYCDQVNACNLRQGRHDVAVYLFSSLSSPISMEIQINSSEWMPVSVETFNDIFICCNNLSIPENSHFGTVAGSRLQAIDEDHDSKVYYTIIKEDFPGFFTIEKDTGQIILSIKTGLLITNCTHSTVCSLKQRI
ncbi:unnamed protein product [Phytophthora fragariaefolia]|uniref:Unnamed protein product n=1 Tax=Phytophthora fragariaefolia TaxID=1490495 RepID=A0A9W6YP95_9STRA|nr:unnamed protein product [Phytophthora fragariaefolia]